MFTHSAHPKKNPFGRGEVFRVGFFAAKPIGLAAALLLAMAPASAWAQTVYTWTGSVSSDFNTAGNWSGGNIPPTNNHPNALNARITVANGSAHPLFYTSAQGHTLYAASGGGTSDRSLFIASGTNGRMEIQGGVFESQAVGRDGMANGAVGSLTINGGQYIDVNGTGARTFLVVFGGNGTGTLTIQSGTFAVNTLRFGDASNSTGKGYVDLTGGLLSVVNIIDTGEADSYLYLNGGTLQARADHTQFLQDLNNAYISTGGAVIDTQTYLVTIPVVLQHDPSLGSTPDGGLTKKGAGTLTLSGASANTFTGTTTVQEGRLHLNKSANINALGGNLVISGGQVTFANNEQIPDTATVTMSSGVFNGTAPNTGQRTNHLETLASLVVTGGAFNTGVGSPSRLRDRPVSPVGQAIPCSSAIVGRCFPSAALASRT